MPQLIAVVHLSDTVEQNGKFEVQLELSAAFDNPYDYDQVAVSAVFTGPGGVEKSVDGFFMQAYELNTADGALTPDGRGGFRVRFAPDRTGEWAYRLSVTDRHGTVWSEERSFSCMAAVTPENRGFVRAGATNYLQFDNGEQYIPVGENIAWPVGNAYLDYRDWLTALRANGGNYFRLWHAHWGLGIEWRAGWRDFEGLRRYHQPNGRYQDWLFDFCAENGIYIMLCLQHHGQVSSRVNPNWVDSPYNAANGGPCANTWEFFTDEVALAHTRNRLRYIVARWGYARSIMAWELFNEVDWTDDYEAHRDAVSAWHIDMAAYLKSIDPYDRLVTTSYAYSNREPLVWAGPDIDITQTHFYLNTSNIERTLAGDTRFYLDQYGKPTLNGEFGLGPYPELSNADADGIHLHNGLWGALFGGGLGTAMSWWWDSYVHPRNLYYHFAPVAAIAREIPLHDADMRPAVAYVQGAPGDLVLPPTLDWGIVGDDTIYIDENGMIEPENPGLGIFLYGSQWNTEFRSPPTFSVYYPVAGTFTVRTNMESGVGPRLAIFLDGERVLDEAAGVNQSYTVEVPPGRHYITVDNPGIDWITIASYTFAGAGAGVDAYVLKGQDRSTSAGWVLNHAYNHVDIAEKGPPDPVIGAQLLVEEVEDGGYTVFWYDCLTGAPAGATPARAVNGRLAIDLPELYWDLAFLAVSNPTALPLAVQGPAFELYPNPAAPGSTLTLSKVSATKTPSKLALLDAAGKVVRLLSASSTREEKGGLQVALPADLPGGLYWLLLESEGSVGSRPVVVAP